MVAAELKELCKQQYKHKVTRMNCYCRCAMKQSSLHGLVLLGKALLESGAHLWSSVVLFVMLGNGVPYTSLIRSPARVAATVVANVSQGEKATLAWITKSLHKLPRLPVDVTLSMVPAPLLI